MITTRELGRLISCDLCKRRIPNVPGKKECIVCGKDACGYCSIDLTRTFRKRFNCGYSQYHKKVGSICVKCINKKLKLKLEKLKYT